MKRDFSELKKSKPFYPFDLIIYGLLTAFIIAVFAAVFLFKGSTPAQGFFVMYENKVAAEYRWDDGNLKIKDGYASHFSETENGFYFYPDPADKNRYNLVVIERAAKTVSVKEATCAGRDCISHKVNINGGFIYCAPHNLKITPMGLTDPVSG